MESSRFVKTNLPCTRCRTMGSNASRAGVSAVALILVLVVVLAAGGGAWYFFAQRSGKVKFDPLMATASIKPFTALVLEQGQIESSENVEFLCEIKSRYGETRVIDVIPEGSFVQAGEVLVRLETSRLEEARNTQEIAVANAEKLVQQANGKLQAAEIAKIEYLEGKFEEAKATILSEIFVAEEELRKAEEYARFSERLAAKSFVTELQLEADLFAVDRYRNQLDLARQKLRVLENQTKPKEIIGFDSEILAAQAELSSAEKARDLEVAALADILDQLEKCTIEVPEGLSGQVVYANVFSSRGGSEWVLEKGAAVREGQVLLRLPNLNKMQVFAKVNEAQIAAVDVGMPVKVQVDAMRSAGAFEGFVTKVNPYAEPESWTSGGVRRYGCYIELVDPPSNIRPGMNASVTIETRYEAEALQIPVQALAEQQGIYYIAVKQGESFETRKVKVVAANAESAWIEEGIERSENGIFGVEPGEEVVLGPRAFDGLLDLPPVVESANPRRGQGRPNGAGGPGAGGPGRGGPGAGGPGAGGGGRGPGGAAAGGAAAGGAAAGNGAAPQGQAAGDSSTSSGNSAPANGGAGAAGGTGAPGGGGFRPSNSSSNSGS